MTHGQKGEEALDAMADAYASYWEVCRIDPYSIADGWTDREGNAWRWDNPTQEWKPERRKTKRSRPKRERRRS